MTGKFDIQLQTKRIAYKFCVSRNLTVLYGETAEGKTAFIRALTRCLTSEESIEYDLVTLTINGVSGVENIRQQVGVSCATIPTGTMTNEAKLRLLKTYSNCIVFIDEDTSFTKSTEFLSYLSAGADIYVVICARDVYKLSGIPVAISEVYQFKTYDTTTIGVSRYRGSSLLTFKAAPLSIGSLRNYTVVLTEDSGIGFLLFKHLLQKHGVLVRTAKGKDFFYRQLRKEMQNTVIIADQAVFGASIDRTLMAISPDRSILISLPESFEWCLLHLHCFSNDDYVQKCLNTPWCFADTKKYLSWEQFFTAVLTQAMQKMGLNYSKTCSLDTIFKLESNEQELLRVLLFCCGLKL